jgi:hypothetical protein
MIHMIHGIHTGFNDVTVPGLVPYLERTGEYVVHPNYGYILAMETKRINPIVVGLLLPYIEPGDILIGHSNGCAIVHDLLVAGAKASGIVFINGALDRDVTLPFWVKWADVYFNDGDTITEVAELADRLGLVARCWGEMGHAGYSGQDVRFKNIDCGKTSGMPRVNGHSDLFTSVNLPAWGDFISKRILINKEK